MRDRILEEIDKRVERLNPEGPNRDLALAGRLILRDLKAWLESQPTPDAGELAQSKFGPSEIIKEARQESVPSSEDGRTYQEHLISRLADALENSEIQRKIWMKDCLSNEDGVLLLQRQIKASETRCERLASVVDEARELWLDLKGSTAADIVGNAGAEMIEDLGKAIAALEAP